MERLDEAGVVEGEPVDDVEEEHRERDAEREVGVGDMERDADETLAWGRAGDDHRVAADGGGDDGVFGFGLEAASARDVYVAESADPAHERVASAAAVDDGVDDVAFDCPGRVVAGGCEVEEVAGVGDRWGDTVENGEIVAGAGVAGVGGGVLLGGDARELDRVVQDERAFEVEVAVCDHEHADEAAAGEQGVGVVVDVEYVDDVAGGDLDAGLEVVAGGRDLRVDAKFVVAGGDVERLGFDEVAFAVDAQVDGDRLIGVVADLDVHLVVRAVRRVSAHVERGDADISALGADRDVEHVDVRRHVDVETLELLGGVGAVGDEDDLTARSTGERVDGERHRLADVGLRGAPFELADLFFDDVEVRRRRA